MSSLQLLDGEGEEEEETGGEWSWEFMFSRGPGRQVPKAFIPVRGRAGGWMSIF